MPDKIHTDWRVIVLGKALTLSENNYHYKRANTEKNRMIALGYFDALEVRPLEAESSQTEPRQDEEWLDILWRDSVRESCYLDTNIYSHPIYVVSYEAEGEATAQEDPFWKINCEFFLVTFVQAQLGSSRSADCSTEPESRSRFDILKNLVPHEIGTGDRKVVTRCYQTIDLSDMVVFWRSNSLRNILDALYKLYLQKEVGDLHTICAFPYTLINPQEETDAADCIPYVSFRFGTKDPESAHKLIDKIQKEWRADHPLNAFFTTGTEDVNITLRELPVSDFLSLIRLWYHKDFTTLFKKAFFESSTHLGVLDGGSGGTLVCDTELSDLCGAMLKDFQAWRMAQAECKPGSGDISKEKMKQLARIDFSWMKSVSTQLTVLAEMSRICVLDGFSYLILDSVQMFCKRVKELLEEGKPLPSKLLGSVQRFVRGWGILMEQGIRTDGQVTQNPGFSPALYDIPVELLEFYLAFTSRCMDLLENGEKDANHYALFFLPKLCRRTKVEDVFRTPPPSDRLLYVDIPLDLLYQPKQILLQLCHEVSHFSGNEYRCRDRRFQYYTRNCAQLIAWFFDLGFPRVCEQIALDLAQGIEAKDQDYMVNLRPAMMRQFYSLLGKPRYLRCWQDLALDAIEEEGGEPRAEARARLARKSTLMQYSGRLADLEIRVEHISYFYQECYADISMIFLLQPSRDEYFSLYEQELEWLRGNAGSHLTEWAQLVQRITLVDRVIWPQAFSKPEPSKVAIEHLKCSVFSLERSIREGNSAIRSYLPAPVLRVLGNYLSDCYGAMTKKPANEDELAELRVAFANVARLHYVGGPEFQRILAWYEAKRLGALKKAYKKDCPKTQA